MAENWLSISEAAAMLGISVRTLQRRLADNEYQTKTEGNKKYVLLPTGGNNMTVDRILAEKDKLVESLTQQVEYLQKALDDANHGRERSDTIMLSLTQQLNEQTKMIEDMRHSRPLRRERSHYRVYWQRVKARLGFQTVG